MADKNGSFVRRDPGQMRTLGEVEDNSYDIWWLCYQVGTPLGSKREDACEERLVEWAK